MIERRLIGNILAEEGEAEEEQKKFILTKRKVLLNKDELTKIHRRRRSDPEIMSKSWQDEEHDLFESKINEEAKSPLDTKAPEYIPASLTTVVITCEYSGRIVEMSREQNGSRLLQQKLETFSHSEIQAVFEEVIKSFKALAIDIFGNFVIQKLIEVGTKDQRKIILGLISGKVVEYSMHLYACRVIQKALEFSDTEQRRIVVIEFKSDLEVCLENEFANHVIQKCIEVLPYQYVEFIVDCIKGRTIYWIEHKFGCRIIQRIIEKVPRECINEIFTITIMNSVRLSKSNFGNYVVQHILEKGCESDKNDLIRSFYGKVNDLSTNKIASNVIEKCLRKGAQAHIEAICEELFDPRTLQSIATDKFSNFVVQRALEVSKGQNQVKLIKRITDIAQQLKAYKFGKYVLNCIEKINQADKH